MIFNPFSTWKLWTSFIHIGSLFITFIRFITTSTNRHSSIISLIIILKMHNRRSFSSNNIFFCICIFFLKVISHMNLFYNLLVFILDLFDFFLKILKLLMEMCYLLCSSWIFLIIYSSWRRQSSCITWLGDFIPLSKPLIHFKNKYCYKHLIIIN